MTKTISYINYVPSHEQEVICLAVNRVCKIAERESVPHAMLIKPLEIIYKDIEGYGFIQPLIDGHGGIAGHRVYINSNYILTDTLLERLVAHEVIHTFSYKNILTHESRLFRAIAHNYEVFYSLNVTGFTAEDIDEIERSCKL